MSRLTEIADKADIIVNGYAFTKNQGNIQVLNLNNPEKASVLNATGEIIETSMDDIEICIIKEYLEKNAKYMEG